ncbi:MAG: hypothetical protein JPMHGGIA_00721 [Saprospiraceae bacterium]|nr:hypothetical protein [Saprospiraceae bacterium]
MVPVKDRLVNPPGIGDYGIILGSKGGERKLFKVPEPAPHVGCSAVWKVLFNFEAMFKDRLWLALLSMIGVACNTGYERQGANWVWVSYNENDGKREMPILGSDGTSFEVLQDERFAKDRSAVYFEGRPITGADPQNFTLVGESSFSKDGKQVFLDCLPLIHADPTSFVVLEYPYSKDARNVFCGTLPIKLEPGEMESFQVTNEDRMLAATKSTILLSEFVRFNPDYQWLDTLSLTHVIVGNYGTAKTARRRFNGYLEAKP